MCHISRFVLRLHFQYVVCASMLPTFVHCKHSEYYYALCCYHCIRVPARLCCPLMPSFRFLSAMFFAECLPDSRLYDIG